MVNKQNLCPLFYTSAPRANVFGVQRLVFQNAGAEAASGAPEGMKPIAKMSETERKELFQKLGELATKHKVMGDDTENVVDTLTNIHEPNFNKDAGFRDGLYQMLRMFQDATPAAKAELAKLGDIQKLIDTPAATAAPRATTPEAGHAAAESAADDSAYDADAAVARALGATKDGAKERAGSTAEKLQTAISNITKIRAIIEAAAKGNKDVKDYTGFSSYTSGGSSDEIDLNTARMNLHLRDIANADMNIDTVINKAPASSVLAFADEKTVHSVLKEMFSGRNEKTRTWALRNFGSQFNLTGGEDPIIPLEKSIDGKEALAKGRLKMLQSFVNNISNSQSKPQGFSILATEVLRPYRTDSKPLADNQEVMKAVKELLEAVDPSVRQEMVDSVPGLQNVLRIAQIREDKPTVVKLDGKLAAAGDTHPAPEKPVGGDPAVEAAKVEQFKALRADAIQALKLLGNGLKGTPGEAEMSALANNIGNPKNADALGNLMYISLISISGKLTDPAHKAVKDTLTAVLKAGKDAGTDLGLAARNMVNTILSKPLEVRRDPELQKSLDALAKIIAPFAAVPAFDGARDFLKEPTKEKLKALITAADYAIASMIPAPDEELSGDDQEKLRILNEMRDTLEDIKKQMNPPRVRGGGGGGGGGGSGDGSRYTGEKFTDAVVDEYGSAWGSGNDVADARFPENTTLRKIPGDSWPLQLRNADGKKLRSVSDTDTFAYTGSMRNVNGADFAKVTFDTNKTGYVFVDHLTSGNGASGAGAGEKPADGRAEDLPKPPSAAPLTPPAGLDRSGAGGETPPGRTDRPQGGDVNVPTENREYVPELKKGNFYRLKEDQPNDPTGNFKEGTVIYVTELGEEYEHTKIFAPNLKLFKFQAENAHGDKIELKQEEVEPADEKDILQYKERRYGRAPETEDLYVRLNAAKTEKRIRYINNGLVGIVPKGQPTSSPKYLIDENGKHVPLENTKITNNEVATEEQSQRFIAKRMESHNNDAREKQKSQEVNDSSIYGNLLWLENEEKNPNHIEKRISAGTNIIWSRMGGGTGRLNGKMNSDTKVYLLDNGATERQMDGKTVNMYRFITDPQGRVGFVAVEDLGDRNDDRGARNPLDIPDQSERNHEILKQTFDAVFNKEMIQSVINIPGSPESKRADLVIKSGASMDFVGEPILTGETYIHTLTSYRKVGDGSYSVGITISIGDDKIGKTYTFNRDKKVTGEIK